MINVELLCAQWREAKDAEAEAVAKRREIEDQLKAYAMVPENAEGTITIKNDAFNIKVVGRIDRKVDAERVQELAAEHGLTEHLSALFRWKPEINMSVWKSADSSITEPLLGAITSKPGRPSFTITVKE